VFHAPLIVHATGMVLSAVVTGDPGRQKQSATEYPEARVFGSVEELWASAADFDMAVIATPTARHLPDAMQALRLGLHVVVDKPVAGTAAEAELLVREAVLHDRQVHVFHNRRWDSDFLGIRQLAEAGALGDPLFLESRMESLRPVRRESWRNSPRPQDFGGVLIDLGSHLVDQAIQLMGPVESVFARIHAVRAGAGADDQFSMHLAHEGGSTSLLVAGKATPFPGHRLAVLGTRASARVAWTDSQEAALRDGMSPAAASWGGEPATSAVEVCAAAGLGESEVHRIPAPRGGWNTFYPRVLRAIREGQPPPVPLQDAVETMRVLDAARTSAAGGATIVLSPPARHGSASGT